MFRPTPAIIRFSSERVFVFVRLMLLCNDGEISSPVVFITIAIKRRSCGGGGVLWCWYALAWGAKLASFAPQSSAYPHHRTSPPQPRLLTFWRRNYFFKFLAHPVYKMWIIQKPNTLELWNKLHFEEKKKRRVYTVFKIFSTYICWINI